MAHSNWHYQGFLKNVGVLDYAGGNVVHICSGASGLATVAVVGNRKGWFKIIPSYFFSFDHLF